MINKLLIFLFAWSLAACQQSIEQVIVQKNSLKNECVNLYRPNNINELVMQIYQHSDKPCFYTQSGKELSDVWGISVINLQDYADNQTEFYQKRHELFTQVCQSKLQGVYLTIEPAKSTGHEESQMEFTLSRCYLDKFGGLDKNLDFFQNLPKPNIQGSAMHSQPLEHGEKPIVFKYQPNENGMFDINHYYIWYKTQSSGMYVYTWYHPEIYSIYISDKFRTFY